MYWDSLAQNDGKRMGMALRFEPDSDLKNSIFLHWEMGFSGNSGNSNPPHRPPPLTPPHPTPPLRNSLKTIPSLHIPPLEFRSGCATYANPMTPSAKSWYVNK